MTQGADSLARIDAFDPQPTLGSVAFGTLIGPSAAGYAFDIVHSNTLPISASVCTNIIAACIMAAIARAPVPLHKAGGAHGD